MRVISKENLDESQPNREEIDDIIYEIRIQRTLKLCGNTVKLLRLHESMSNIYLFLNYEGGGSIGDLIEQGLYISEENAWLIME